MTKIEREEVIFEGGVRYKVLPFKGFDRFQPLDTTPSVLNLETWIANNVVTSTITQFDDGAEEQRLKILGDGHTVVANNANIKTSTGADKLLSSGLVYVFTYINSVWYEDADLSSGTPGPVGPVGPPGNDGMQGIQGVQGLQGVQGIQGNSGVDGKTGLTLFVKDGKDGKDSFIPGPAGQSIVGPQGIQGIQGQPAIVFDGKPGKDGFPIPGKDGAQGIQGIQGIPGSTILSLDGKPGPMGFSIPGPTGIQGIAGNNGINGKDGNTILSIDGKEGRWGFPGPKGDKGDTGPAGASGTGGGSSQLILPKDGLTGPQGISIPAQGIKVSSLPLGSLLAATEFPVNNAGVSQKVTGQSVLDLIGDSIQNASIADQAVGASTTAYITDSKLIVPPAKLRLRSWFRWKVWVDKTAAGTIALIFLVKIGTLGTTGDTTLFTITLGVGTAAVDTGWLDITIVLRGPLSAAGIFIMEAIFDHTLATTGLNNVQRQTQQTVSAGFDVTTAGLILGLAVTTPALYALTFRTLTAEAKNL